ncbi:MAG: rhodanese-like domain-containing protein, partial [Flavobacteriaceae bacterium]|nr:rhodanese-like domain-containing protein [Flavobacteriaceae bacterium]
RLSRVGFDNTIGFLNGGIDAWEKAGKETDAIKSIGVDAFEKIYFSEHPAVFDVRKENEYLASHLSKAENTPLDNLNDFLKTYPTSENFYLHCAGGYRSIIAASILKSRGIHNLIDIAGGFGAMKDTRLEIESGD